MNYINTLRDQVDAMLKGFVQALPSLAIALVILILTWLVAKGAVRLADRITGKAHIRNDLKALVETLIKLAVWIVGLLIALTVAIPSFTPAGAFAGLGIGAVAIGFAFQDIFENFLAGVLIMLRDKMQLGDWVDTEGISGTVEKITLRETHIRQFSGELTIMPNSMIFKNPVKIHTDQVERRFDIMVGVAYDTDLPEAEAAIMRALKSVDTIAHNRPVDAFAREFGASSIDFWVRWWVNTKEQNLFLVQRDVVYAIKRELDAAGIEIPFPYVTHTFKEDVPIKEMAASNDAA
ncbi:mechanosensitive ion channel protein MscS [Novosphingobium sp. PC22D]|uniref:mechanosensitive ion channel family protein n=1 Tax=Novosphingobium sp. PC22D TaxID=1962403 RepID=UPI000BF0B26A|nr:mechanosensitive ion channel [Novosphingobium sp. PC22D]PEQ13361.1 mechanosensitive ion channel protein MscS [Novosphingobium sp. PC22D]